MISPLRSILGPVALLLTAALGSAYAQSTEPATPPATPPTPPAATEKPAPTPASQKPAPATAASGNTIPVNLELHAGVRYRWEIDGRAKFAEDASTTEFSLLRSQLSVGVQLPKGVSLFVQGQDSRVWGEETSTEDGSAPRGDMHQGYFLAEDFMTPGAWLQIGRTEMALGNERLVGDNDFTNTGRAFDAIAAGYGVPGSYDVRIFESKISEGVGSAVRGKDRDFFGAFGSYLAIPEHAIDGYVLFDTDQDTLSSGEEFGQRITFGARGHGDVSLLNYEVELAYQTGDELGVDVSAYLFGARAAYAIAHAYQPTVGIGFDLLSGNDPDDTSEVGVFNTLFADNHGFYGLMDFFVDIPRDTRGGGLTDFMLWGTITPSPRFSAQLQFHNFSASEDVRLEGSDENLSAFGNEIDVVGDIPCTENVAVQIGGGLFMPGEIFEATRGDGSAYWAYLQTRVSY
jgi:hypothetical protein